MIRTIKTVCQEGICPICNGQLDYEGGFDLQDDGGTYRWHCPDCGANGREGYNLVFDGNHYNVTDSNGTSVAVIPPTQDVPSNEEPPLCTYRIGFNDGDETEVDAASLQEALHLALDIALESNYTFFRVDYTEQI